MAFRPIDASSLQMRSRVAMEHAAPRPLLTSLPNILTYGRILAVPALVACLFFMQGDPARWSAFALFVAACVTDWLAGDLPRPWDPAAPPRPVPDPTADKLLLPPPLPTLTHHPT